MSQLPAARLVPRDAADQRIRRRELARAALKRNALRLWALCKLVVTAALLVLAVGVALHVLQNWGEGGLTTAPSAIDERARRIELEREQLRQYEQLLRESRSPYRNY